MEDLWAFNDEGLARAVAASAIPVVSAVGHETDFTICDFAADLRAPTPSAAAELCTPEIGEEKSRAAAFHRYFWEGSRKTVEYLRQSLDLLVQDSPLGEPGGYLRAYRERLDGLDRRLAQRGRGRLEEGRGKLSLLAGKLDALSPLKVLARGYAIPQDREGRVITSVGALTPGERLTLTMADGQADCVVKESRCR